MADTKRKQIRAAIDTMLDGISGVTVDTRLRLPTQLGDGEFPYCCQVPSSHINKTLDVNTEYPDFEVVIVCVVRDFDDPVGALEDHLQDVENALCVDQRLGGLALKIMPKQ